MSAKPALGAPQHDCGPPFVFLHRAVLVRHQLSQDVVTVYLEDIYLSLKAH